MPLANQRKACSWILFLLVCLGTGFNSCRKDATPLAIKIVQLSTLVGESGEYLKYDIELICDEPISLLKIEQFNPKHGNVTVLDSATPAKKLIWYYQVPFFDDSAMVTLTFTAVSENHTNSVTRSVLIINNEVPLTEYAGNAFFSNLSGKPNAFILQGLQSVFYTLPTTLKPDFADNSIDSVHHNTLSREWISPAGLFFARLNDFNYAQATSNSVKSAFDIAVKYNSIKNLSSDDILIVGNSSEALGAIRFTQVIDTDSTIDDKYLFNIKTVE